MATVVVVVCLLGVLVVSPPAMAKFSSAAAGSGKARAVLVATPSAPTAVFGGISGLGGILCTINVSWTPAPPADRSYTLYRVINGSPTIVMAASTSATSYSDTFLIALLTGNPSYFLRSTLVGTTWIKDSAATVSHC